MSRNGVILIILLLAAFAVPVDSTAVEDDRQTAPVFEVPTSGTIMDVIYRPEFDEWWIKCREGESVVVYSYDPESKKWGKVRFVRKKSDPEKATTVPNRPKSEKEQPVKLSPQTERTDKAVEKKDSASPTLPAAERVKEESAAPKKKPVATKQEKKKANWWGLRNVLKSGEKLINPFKGGEERKPSAKPEDPVPGG